MFDLILSACLKQVLLYIKICVSLPGLQLAIQKENLESCSISPDSSSSFGSTSSETELLTVKENVRFGGSCEDLAVIEKEATEFQDVENIEVGANHARKLSGLSDLDQEIVPDLGHEISFDGFCENKNMLVKEADVCQDVKDVAKDEDCIRETSVLSYLEQEIVHDLGHEISVGGGCEDTGLLEKETTELQNVDNTKVDDNHGEVIDSSHFEQEKVHDLGNEITIENVSDIVEEDLKDMTSNIESNEVSVDLFDVHLKSESPNVAIDDGTIEHAIFEPDDCTHGVNEVDTALDSVRERDGTVNDNDDAKCRTVDDDETIIVQVEEGLKPEADISDILVEVSNRNIVDSYDEAVGEIEVPALPVDDCDCTDLDVVDNQREDESDHFNKSFAIELISTEGASVLMSSIANDRSSHTEALENQSAGRLREISDSSQDRSKNMQDSPISFSTETVSPVLTPEHEHATGFYEVNPGPLQDKSLNMQSSGISETISPVETPEHEHATGFYEVNSDPLQDKSLNMQSSGISETISPVETPEHEHAKGFYEVNPEPLQDITLNLQSSGISETVSLVETPEHEHATGFYEVNSDPLQDESLNMQSSGISETISPVETPEHEHAKGFYEVKPEPLQDKSLDMQSSGISETISPVETPEHEHAKEFYEVNSDPLQDKSLNMQSSGISETISPVETPEHEHAKGFYEVNTEPLQDKSLNMQSCGMQSSGISETISPVETPEHEHAKGFYEVNPEPLQDKSLDMQSSGISETISPVETPEHEHAKEFYEVNSDPLQDKSLNMQSSGISETISPVETPEHEHAKGFYEVNTEPLQDKSLNMQSCGMQSSGISETISPVETPEHEHAKGFYDVNPDPLQDKSLNMQSSGIFETISPVETPEHDHSKGFYEVNPESSQEKTFNMQSSDMSLSPETISPVETPEHEHVDGFHEVNPVISFTSSDTLDNELGDTTEGEVKEEDLNAQLQGTVLQNIALGKISSPVDNPSEYNISENYKINPMIPDITIEEDVDVKSDVFDLADLGLTRDEKFIEMTTNLVQNVINGAIKYIVDMKQTNVVEKDTLSQYVVREEYLDPVSQVKTSVNSHEVTMDEQELIDNVNLEAVHTNHIIDRSEFAAYPADSDSDESVESSTTTEGSYRIINSRDTSPLNTPDTSAIEDFVGAQKDTTVGAVQEHTIKTEIEGTEVMAEGKSNESECSEKKVVPQSEEERDILDILDAVNADTLASSVRSDSSEEDGKASNCTDTGEVAEISASSSDSSDYVKKHKVEYTTRKQIFMTSAGRMSISIDSIADPLSDPDQPYMMTEHDTIHEETHAEVGYIIARAHSIIGHADETLARLSDSTIARLKELADAAVSNSKDVDVVMFDDMDVVCDSSLLLSKVVTCLPSSTVNALKFQTLYFLFSKKMWVTCIRAGIHKILVRIANREDPDQTASEEAV